MHKVRRFAGLFGRMHEVRRSAGSAGLDLRRGKCKTKMRRYFRRMHKVRRSAGLFGSMHEVCRTFIANLLHFLGKYMRSVGLSLQICVLMSFGKTATVLVFSSSIGVYGKTDRHQMLEMIPQNAWRGGNNDMNDRKNINRFDPTDRQDRQTDRSK